MRLDYASRVLARHGEAVSGDAVFVRIGEHTSLFAVIDGLGHGEAAFRVAERGLQILTELPPGAGATTAMSALNTKLHGTRGAAATACSISGQHAEIAGIGNVVCRSIGFNCPFVPTPGIVGLRPSLRDATRVSLSSGHGLVLHSDGISQRLETQLLSDLTPDAACDYLLYYHRYQHDDASVLVIRAGSHLSPRAVEPSAPPSRQSTDGFSLRPRR